jgi:hypothetical protein
MAIENKLIDLFDELYSFAILKALEFSEGLK